VHRNWLVFFIKNILVIVIIIEGVLLALRLNPLVPPLLGGRFSSQIFGMVLIANRSDFDLEEYMGNVTELLWLDWFYFFHFVTCLIALVETATVHLYIRAGHDSFALRIDQVFRIVMPYVVYPICLLGLLLWATHDALELGLTLVCLGIALPIAAGAMRVKYLAAMAAQEKAKIAVQLVTAPDEEIDDSTEAPLLRKAFDMFDLDGSGDIDSKEIRALLDVMYPAMPRPFRKQALKMIVTREGSDDVRFEDFDETILEWRKFAQQHDPQFKWHGRQQGKKLRLLSSMSKMSSGAVEMDVTDRSTV